MKKCAVLAILCLVIGALYMAFGQTSAQITVLDRFYSTMAYEPDAQQPVPEQMTEVHTVKRGYDLGGIIVASVTDSKITFKIPDPVFDVSIRDSDGNLLENKGVVKRIALKKGQTLCLTDIGILDASHTIEICYQ